MSASTAETSFIVTCGVPSLDAPDHCHEVFLSQFDSLPDAKAFMAEPAQEWRKVFKPGHLIVVRRGDETGAVEAFGVITRLRGKSAPTEVLFSPPDGLTMVRGPTTTPPAWAKLLAEHGLDYESKSGPVQMLLTAKNALVPPSLITRACTSVTLLAAPALIRQRVKDETLASDMEAFLGRAEACLRDKSVAQQAELQTEFDEWMLMANALPSGSWMSHAEALKKEKRNAVDAVSACVYLTLRVAERVRELPYLNMQFKLVTELMQEATVSHASMKALITSEIPATQVMFSMLTSKKTRAAAS